MQPLPFLEANLMATPPFAGDWYERHMRELLAHILVPMFVAFSQCPTISVSGVSGHAVEFTLMWRRGR